MAKNKLKNEDLNRQNTYKESVLAMNKLFDEKYVEADFLAWLIYIKEDY